jgi:hypothetical protein
MFASNDCRIERMMDPRKNWRSGFHTALMLMLVITAIMQSAALATPLITTLQHVHVEQSSGTAVAAGGDGIPTVLAVEESTFYSVKGAFITRSTAEMAV